MGIRGCVIGWSLCALMACGGADPAPAGNDVPVAPPEDARVDGVGAEDAVGDAPRPGDDADAEETFELPPVDVPEDPGPPAPEVSEDVPEDVPSPPDVPADAPGPEPDTPAPGPWRSALYPEDWTPAFTDAAGRFLHDFSYAGYRRGEAPLPDGAGLATLDVVADHGADPTGATDSTAMFQAAIGAAGAAGGGVVFVPSGLYRLDGTLTVTHDHVILRGQGPAQSRLYFTSVPPSGFVAHISFQGYEIPGVEADLTVDGAARGAEVTVADTAGFAVGDHVQVGWVITDAFVADHEMTGTWEVFNGSWQPFFRREVVAVGPTSLTLDVPLRYPARVSDGASVRLVTGQLEGCGVEGLGLSNAAPTLDAAWEVNQVHVLSMIRVMDCWVRDVASFTSPQAPPAEGDMPEGAHLQSSGVMVTESKRVTVQDTTMGLAQHRGGGGNGYLFEVRQSSEVLFADCAAHWGRHNFIQNWGFGTSGCVWLRVLSTDGQVHYAPGSPFFSLGYSETHHSLAMANLVDQSTFHDGWQSINREDWSSGAGHTGTENVVYNVSGDGGIVRSRQWGWGYVVGTSPEVDVITDLDGTGAAGTAPPDWVEGPGLADGLEPPSLYEDQLARRLGAE